MVEAHEISKSLNISLYIKNIENDKVKWNYVQMQKYLFEVEGPAGVLMLSKKDIQNSIIIMIQQILFLFLETHLILTHLIKIYIPFRLVFSYWLDIQTHHHKLEYDEHLRPWSQYIGHHMARNRPKDPSFL